MQIMENKRKPNSNHNTYTEDNNQEISNIYICKDKVIVPEATKKGYGIANENDCIYINRPCQKRGVVQRNMIQTLKTDPSDLAIVIINNEKYALRFLTEKECTKLMGFSLADYQALVDIGLSRRQIEHIMGDSIITTCLVALLNPFVNEEHKHIDIINEYVERNIIEHGQ